MSQCLAILTTQLEELKRGLRAAERLLKPGGRLAVISFQSLDDNMVRDFFHERSHKAPNGNILDELRPTFRLLSSKPIRPTLEEMEVNLRSRYCA